MPEFLQLGQNVGTRGLRYSHTGRFSRTIGASTAHLTLNLGLRYELHTPQYEVDNRATNYGEFTGQVVSRQQFVELRLLKLPSFVQPVQRHHELSTASRLGLDSVR